MFIVILILIMIHENRICFNVVKTPIENFHDTHVKLAPVKTDGGSHAKRAIYVNQKLTYALTNSC